MYTPVRLIMISTLTEPITKISMPARQPAIRPRVYVATAVTFVLLIASFTVPLKGQWIDRLLSGYLSHKYGQTVQVAHVRIDHGTSLSFDFLQVKSPEGNWLIRAQSGTLRFRKIGIAKNAVRKIEIHLKDAAFSKDYYKDYRYQSPFGFLVTKPMVMQSLTLLVTQKGRMTHVGVVSSSSKDVILSGSLILDDTRVVKDNILISFSPGMMMRAVT